MKLNVQSAYNLWAARYDTNDNKTRDLEGASLRETLSKLKFSNCLEMGCGTGKNTEWLISRADRMLAVDLSEEMLAVARQKIESDRVDFIQADINEDWGFTKGKQFDLATFSLVLEHIENLEAIFEKLSLAVSSGGQVYVGELHPLKQYTGSKARFETEDGLQIVTCFTHHLSDFTGAATRNGFELVCVNEYFDDDDRTTLPRILTLLFRKI